MDLNAVVTLSPNQSINDLAEQISSEIMDKYEKNFLYHITEEEYSLSSPEGRREILDIALKNASPLQNEVRNIIHYNRRKTLIEESTMRYLRENGSINLHGFMNFRIGDYKDELYDICINAGEEYAANKEYDEFLDMLKFFISVETPHEEVVHIIKNKNDFSIYNRLKRDITDMYGGDLPREEDFTPEDILLSTLIAIVPEKIVIHDKKENHQIYETIEAIFNDVIFV